MSKKLTILFAILILIASNISIIIKEYTVKKGEIVLLELRPVDPRSIMQGDYMALNFSISNSIEHYIDSSQNRDGFVVLYVNQDRTADFVRLYTGENLELNEIKVKYRVRNSRVKFGTNAFFFQEGTGHNFELAKYGEFRLSSRGEIILTHLLSEDLERIDINKKATQ